MDTRYNRVKDETTDSTGSAEESNTTSEQEGDKDAKQMDFMIAESNETDPFIPALNRKRKRTFVSDEIFDKAKNSKHSDNFPISSALNTGAEGIKFEGRAPAKTSLQHHKSDFSFISESNSESSLNNAKSNLPTGNKYEEVSGSVSDRPISPNVSPPVSSRHEMADSNMETTNTLENTNAVAGPSGIRTQTIKLGQETFTCNLCDKEFAESCDFDMHYRTHTNERLFVCNICQKGFTKKAVFENHYRTHTDERTFVCDICEKKFLRKEHLNNHYKVHTGEKPHVCGVCQRGFNKKINLEKHYITHTGEKPFECDVCQKRFTQKGNFDRHYRTHTDERPFVCDICPKKFYRKECLDVHYNTHTGNKPHVCDVCKREFTQKAHLEKHCIKHTGEKPFECHVCLRRFTEKSSLQKHCRTHTNEKPFVCEVCERCFSRKSSLRSHEQMHKGEQTNVCNICGKASIKSCNCIKDHKEKQE